MNTPPSLTVVVDTREKQPLLFPAYLPVMEQEDISAKRTRTLRVHCVRQALDTGDYLLRGYEAATIVERKGSLLEVAKNCLDPADRPRFIRALDRLKASCRRPYVLLEGSPASVLSETLRGDPPPLPGYAADALLRVLEDRGIGLVLLPNQTTNHRRAAGEWVLRMLLAGAMTQ